MQELIDEAIKYSRELSTEGYLFESLAVDHIIDVAESLLEKEKEVIMDAYEAGSHTEWNEDTWMLLEKQEYYNETFKNKEK